MRREAGFIDRVELDHHTKHTVFVVHQALCEERDCCTVSGKYTLPDLEGLRALLQRIQDGSLPQNPLELKRAFLVLWLEDLLVPGEHAWRCTNPDQALKLIKLLADTFPKQPPQELVPFLELADVIEDLEMRGHAWNKARTFDARVKNLFKEYHGSEEDSVAAYMTQPEPIRQWLEQKAAQGIRAPKQSRRWLLVVPLGSLALASLPWLPSALVPGVAAGLVVFAVFALCYWKLKGQPRARAGVLVMGLSLVTLLAVHAWGIDSLAAIPLLAQGVLLAALPLALAVVVIAVKPLPAIRAISSGVTKPVRSKRPVGFVMQGRQDCSVRQVRKPLVG